MPKKATKAAAKTAAAKAPEQAPNPPAADQLPIASAPEPITPAPEQAPPVDETPEPSPVSEPVIKAPADDKDFSELASLVGIGWLDAELAKTQSALRNGPGGQGWRFSESKRPAVEELAAFQGALVRLLALIPAV